MYSGPSFWINVSGTFVHLKCFDATNVRFCQRCSTPVGKCRCDANLRDALESPSRLSEQAVWCTKCGQKYPFVSPRGCANEILFQGKRRGRSAVADTARGVTRGVVGSTRTTQYHQRVR